MFWVSPTPVRHVSAADGGEKWTTRGFWEVKVHEEIGGPTLRFCLEEPSIVGVAQVSYWAATLIPTVLRQTFDETRSNYWIHFCDARKS